MTLHGQASRKIDSVELSEDQRVLLCCKAARELESAGEYEAAKAELGERWRGVGQRPKVDDLKDLAKAELLLRAGTLSGWIGSLKQIENAQELAKDLIFESARTFEQLGLAERLADSQVDLAICYWRAGALDEARVTLKQVLNQSEPGSEPRLRALANLALLERVSGRFKEALEIQIQSAPLFQNSNNHALRGNFHNVYAQVLKEMGLAEHKEDYIDRALVEYAAASFHFEQAGHKRFQGNIENNLAVLFASIKRFDEAYQHLDRARSLFEQVKDRGMLAHVDETLARTLISEGRNSEAATAVRKAVRIFQEGDESSGLAEALTTEGTALARLKRAEDALSSFQRAMKVAHQAGDNHAEGLAALAVIEELFDTLTSAEALKYYRKAESLLPGSENPGIKTRLGESARKMLAAVGLSESNYGSSVTDAKDTRGEIGESKSLTMNQPSVPCSLEEEVLRFEGDLIKQALEKAGGSVTRAARLLGTTHQGLAFIINGRQKSLLSARKPVRPRRRSIIRYH